MAIALPEERAGHPATADLAERRAAIDTAIAAGMWRTDPPPQQQALQGRVRTLRFAPKGPPRGTVLHFHGGAFRIGCPETIAPFAAALAERCMVTVVCPAYRLAPEHPFPAGLRDGWSVLQNLTGEASPILLCGDSAGGNIAATLAALADPGALAGLALLSPWLDLSAKGASFARNAASDRLFSAEAAHEAAELYLQGMSADHPLASPLHGQVGHSPPTHISVGTGEVLLSDAERFHDRLQSTGRRSELVRIEGMEHVAVTRDLSLTGAREAFDHLARFIDAQLSPSASLAAT